MSIPNPLDSIQAMITDPAVRIAQGKAPLSSPPVLSDFPYVVIWGDLPTEVSGGGHDAPNLADTPESIEATIRLTYAATSGSSLYWLVNRVRPLLDRMTPAIEGFTCERLRLRSLQPMTQDRDISLEGGRSPIYAIDETRFIAHRN